ncbi:MAG TPA: alkyl hydroperoxide reductase [Longimicrobiales bacterium]
MRKLERWFGSELVVIGVHSGKFIAERVTENIARAAERLEVEHPIVNDRQYRIWRAYAVRAWPTLVLVDADGRIAGQHAGEITAEELAPAVQRVVADAESRGVLDRSPLPFPESVPEPPATALRFPAKVLADDHADRLFVADTGHHRIVVARLEEDRTRATVEAVLGSGEAGFVDGRYEDAAFRHPHGLALAGGRLYVADTGNHAVRVVDLEARRVETVAGTGEPGRWTGRGGWGRAVALRSPWDVLALGDALYIAMAGSHQIWRLDLTSGELAPWAGSGAEALHDGPREQAALAQPSGLATDGMRLYFADSESSAIRWAELDGDGTVGTLVGTGLFDFGDRDGEGDRARLQHPLGIAWRDGELFVADTYNGKIKVVEPERRRARTWAGEEGELWEPGGLSIAAERLYVADTNHHRIAVTPLDTPRLETLELAGLTG